MKTINRIICSPAACRRMHAGCSGTREPILFPAYHRKGQSLYSIASMYGVSQADIIKLNPGSDERIFIGRTLRIPAVPPTHKKKHTTPSHPARPSTG